MVNGKTFAAFLRTVAADLCKAQSHSLFQNYGSCSNIGGMGNSIDRLGDLRPIPTDAGDKN